MTADDIDTTGTVPYPLVAGPSLSDQAYRAVREMITNGTLRGGQRVTERALARQLGVSATPVREAFRRLEHERLIERRDGRTVTIVDPSDSHLATLNLIQGALRGVAARLAATMATEDDLAQIRAAYVQSRKWNTPPRPTPTQRIKTTRRFHQLVDRAAHSDLLTGLIATTTAFDLSDRIRAVEELQDRYPTKTGLDEHEAILAAIEDGDGDRAERLMRAHISRTGELFLSLHRDAKNEEDTEPTSARRGHPG